MAAQLIEIHPENPQPRLIKQVVDCLLNGGIIVYPTDTVYGMGCDLHNLRAIERLCKINQIDPKKLNLSFVCHDLSHLSEYSKQFSQEIFKHMKRNLPGPYTYILGANTKIPKLLNSRKNQVGIRVPDHAIIRNIVKDLGNPVVNTSVKNTEDDILQFISDPKEIYDLYKNQVDIIIDGGIGELIPSTVFDCSNNTIELIREGKGSID